MTEQQAMRMALEYVESVPDDRYNADHIDRDALITVLRQALANQALDKKAENARELGLDYEPEPVAWMYWQSCLNDDGTQTAPWVQRYSKFKPFDSVIHKDVTPLYTRPQPAAWVGLTDEEIKDVFSKQRMIYNTDGVLFGQDIGAKLKEKNT